MGFEILSQHDRMAFEHQDRGKQSKAQFSESCILVKLPNEEV